MRIEIDFDEEKLSKIKKYVEKERFCSVDDFFEKAAKLMIYAEEKKDEFGMILPKPPKENLDEEN